MVEQETQPLFASPQNGETQWTVTIKTKFGPIELPIVRHQLIQEIQDQCEIKSSQRKAILRLTQKAIVRAHKNGLSHLDDKGLEKYKWNLFILKVDEAIKGRHRQVRDDASFADIIADEGHFIAE